MREGSTLETLPVIGSVISNRPLLQVAVAPPALHEALQSTDKGFAYVQSQVPVVKLKLPPPTPHTWVQ